MRPPLLHRHGVYFGIAEPSENERRAREALPPPSWRQLLTVSVISGSMGGGVVGAVEQSAEKGVLFGVWMTVVWVAMTRWKRPGKR